MKASVVIPTFNRKNILPRVLAEFARQTGPDINFELIVIDDGSSDKTHDIFTDLKKINIGEVSLSEERKKIVIDVRGGQLSQVVSSKNYVIDPGIKYIKIVKSGRSVARNIGVELSSHELIIFSDDDIFVEKNYIYKHINFHHLNDEKVVMGKVINTDNLENPFSAKWKLMDINTAFLATGNASVLKTYIEKAGGFDENYVVYGWEDFDLGVHLQQMGIKSVKRPIYGYHYNPIMDNTDPKFLYNKERERGLTAVYFYVNHPLPWVKRFTMVKNRFLPFVVNVFAKRMVERYRQKKTARLKGLKRFLFRYKAYFDGIMEGKREYNE